MPLCTALLQMKVDAGHINRGHTFSGGKFLFFFHAVSQYRWYEDTGITKSCCCQVKHERNYVRPLDNICHIRTQQLFHLFLHTSPFVKGHARVLLISGHVSSSSHLIQAAERAVPLQIVQRFTPHSLVWFLQLRGPKWKYPICPFVTLKKTMPLVRLFRRKVAASEQVKQSPKSHFSF